MLAACRGARLFLAAGPVSLAWATGSLTLLPATLSPHQTAGVVHALSWIAQFTGHLVFEGRAPALFDNLLQALVQAPFFVWIEGCWLCLRLVGAGGFRRALREDLDRATAKAVHAFRAGKGSRKRE
jgi:uncharacterized membrane protein YGL010W